MSAVKDFLENNDFSATTLATYRSILLRFEAWVERVNVDLETMTGGIFKRFLAENPWGDNARHQAYSAVRSFLRWRYGNRHPFLEFVMRKPDTRPQRSLSTEQAQALLQAIDTDCPQGVRNYAIVSLILDTGIRRAEVASLLLEHTDIQARRLIVKIKGDTWGIGRFSDVTADALTDWLTIRASYALPETRTLFVSIYGDTPGARMTSSGVGTIFKSLSRKVGFRVSPHDLRRTFAALTQDFGAPTEIVRRAGRWRNIEQVKSYSNGLQPEAIDPYLVMSRLEGSQD